MTKNQIKVVRWYFIRISGRLEIENRAKQNHGCRLKNCHRASIESPSSLPFLPLSPYPCHRWSFDRDSWRATRTDAQRGEKKVRRCARGGKVFAGNGEIYQSEPVWIPPTGFKTVGRRSRTGAIPVKVLLRALPGRGNENDDGKRKGRWKSSLRF